MKYIGIAILIVSLLFIFGCTSPGTDTNNGSPDGNGKMVVTMTDAAADMGTVSKVNVTIDSIKVKSKTSGWVTVSTEEKTYDLLELKAQSKQVVLVQTDFAIGDVEEIELNIKEASVVDASGTQEAKVPSGRFSIKTNFKVNNESTTVTTFDFIANESLHQTGNGRYIFAPVAQVETRENATVNIQNDTVTVTDGQVKESSKFGMDTKGNVGIGIRIDSNATISIEGDVITVAGLDLGIGNNGSEEENSALADFSALVAAKQAQPFKVNYDYSATVNGQTTTGTMAMYFKAPSMRTDITMQANGNLVTTQAFFKDGKMYTCTNAVGSFMCLESTATISASASGNFVGEVESNQANYNITADGSMSIAQTTATCFKAIGKEQEATTRFCYTADGVPVYTKSEFEGSVTELKATSYSTTVTESDFTLPAQPGSYSVTGN